MNLRRVLPILLLTSLAVCVPEATAQRRVPRRPARANKESPADGVYRQAQGVLRARDFQQAVTLLEQALQLNPPPSTRAYILNDLGESYYELKRYEDAQRVLEDALAILPSFPRAKANLEVVKWSLVPLSPEQKAAMRLPMREAVGVQILGGYVTGLAVGVLFNIGASISGYHESEGRLLLMGAGFVVGSMLRVPQLGRDWSTGDGATPNTFAGALLPPVLGMFAATLKSDSTIHDVVRGATVGSALAPISATLGYRLSAQGYFTKRVPARVPSGGNPPPPATPSVPNAGAGNRDRSRENPFETVESALYVPVASLRF